MNSPARPVEHHVDTLDKVREEHIYVEFRAPDGMRMLWELDLLGDLEQTRDGAIPPVIHMECPLCTTPAVPENRSFLSITYPNKDFELETIPEKKRVYYLVRPGGAIQETRRRPRPEEMLDGTLVRVSKRRLTVKQEFGCDYCGARFRLTDNVLSLLRSGV
jgi:hypothetical protein